MKDYAENELKRGKEWKDDTMKAELNAIEMLSKIACCCTHERLIVSQVAVLTCVALNPTITSGGLVHLTGTSMQNVGRILNYLVNVGDLTFIRESPKVDDYRSLPRHFYITAQGIKTIRRIIRHLQWGDMSRFKIVVYEGGEGVKEGQSRVPEKSKESGRKGENISDEGECAPEKAGMLKKGSVRKRKG